MTTALHKSFTFLLTFCVQTYKSPKEVHVDSCTTAVGLGLGRNKLAQNTPRSARPGYSRPAGAGRDHRPPWKGSDRTPQDTWRLNYLDNDDEIEKVNKLSVLLMGNALLCVSWSFCLKL